MRRVLASIVAGATLALAISAVVVDAAGSTTGAKGALSVGAAIVFMTAILAPAGVGLFVALRRPENRVAWILLIGALSVASVMAASVVAAVALHHDRDATVGAWAEVIAQVWPVLFLWPLALAFVFPDGRLPSRRWRPAAAFALGSGAGAVVLLLIDPTLDGPYGDVANPLPFGLERGVLIPLFWVCWFGLLISLFLGAAVLRARYRTRDAIERRQVLWLAYGALLIPLSLGGSTLVSAVTGLYSDVADGLMLAFLQIWPAFAVAVAVTRHGLYSIDRLLNRTLVYAALTVMLAAAYGVVSVIAGLAIGRSAVVASLATLGAALAFRPLRDRVQRAVDQRFSRARFDAVALLRTFLDDVREGRAEPEDVGAAVAVALDDPRAEIFFRLPETGAYTDRRGLLLDALPDDGRSRASIQRGRHELGVALHTPQLARGPDVLRAVIQAAVVPVELARLRVELRLQLAEVESSRTRIAQAGYEERRRLERDLHDGAQQRLVTLGIMLRRLQRSLPRGAQLLEPALDSAVDEVTRAISDLRTIAAGLRPPRLDEGLAAALADLADGAAVPVEVMATADRAPPAVEAAAYYVACEALTNALKHGAPSHVVMKTARADGVLRLLVADDGVGGAQPSLGSGLAGMHDRVAAQGGSLTIVSPAGEGTQIAVALPCAS